MPGPVLEPPGGLQHHLALVALTPALLALGAAAASAAVRGRAGRILAGVALLPALLLQALFLLPDGIVAQAAGSQLGGLVRIGWVPSSVALLLGLWATWRWRIAASGWAWTLRVALALLLGVLLVPLTLLGIEPDATPSGRRWRLTGMVALSGLAWWWPAWAMAVACLLAATARSPWRGACTVAALAVVVAALV
jgi:hypothetical protein